MPILAIANGESLDLCDALRGPIVHNENFLQNSIDTVHPASLEESKDALQIKDAIGTRLFVNL